MKVFKKIVISVFVSCLLIVPFMGTAQATDLVDPNNIDSIMGYFDIDQNDPESIQAAIDEIKNGGLSGMLGLLGIDISTILDELTGYLNEAATATTLHQEQETVIQETATTEVTTSIIASTSETTTTAISYTQPTASKPLPPKPAAVATTEAEKASEDAEDVTKETDIKASGEQASTEQKTAADNKDSVISKNTLAIISVTIIIFIAGLSAGILISKKLSEKKIEK